ncbi:MAG: LysR family transcriptional regulator [Candidatus Heteroscillospira sp.]|jgi:DNA-binding transcriptional LysR family regulator
MDIRKPEYIVAIADEGSITRAAQRLFLTRPALSHYLLSLEQSLGTPIFQRTRAGLVPTAAGEIYIRGARQVLGAMRQTRKELDDLGGCASGTLRIGITLGNGAVMFNRIFPQFHTRYPGFDVKLLETNAHALEEALFAGDIDFAIMGRSAEMADLEYISFCQTEIFLLLPRDHPLAGLAAPDGQPSAELDIKLLRDDPFIMMHPMTVVGEISERYCRRHGFMPRRLLECSLNTMAYNMVRQGFGPAFVVGSQISAEDRLPRFSLSPREYWWVCIAYRHGTHFTRAEQYFQELVRSYYNENTPFSYAL